MDCSFEDSSLVNWLLEDCPLEDCSSSAFARGVRSVGEFKSSLYCLAVAVRAFSV